MATVILNKEMVDLATKIKKHLRDKYDITVSLADPMLMDKLVELRNLDDTLLQGMLRYLMALAGDEWVKQYSGASPEAPPPVNDSKGLKRLFEVYRGKALRDPAEEELGDPESRKKKAADAMYRGNHPGEDSEAEEKPPEKKKPVRYYRGQPIYD